MITFAEKYPELIKEWDKEKNGEDTPYNTSYGSAKKIHWKCTECAHEWVVTPNCRARNQGCPQCSIKKRELTKTQHRIKNYGSLADKNPSLASEWDYHKNSPLTPYSVTPNSNKKVGWICNICGHKWNAQINSRNKGNGCVKCSTRHPFSHKEKTVLYYVRKMFPNAMENVNSSLFPWLGKLEIDIYIPEYNIGIEYDGVQWHKSMEADVHKNNLCSENKIELIRLREYGLTQTQKSDIVIEGKALNAFEAAIQALLVRLSEKDITRTVPLVNLEQDKVNINLFIYNTKLKNSFLNKYPDIAQEWNYEKNNGLSPENFPAQSNVSVWWKCKTCSHEWQAMLSTRAKGHGCEKCGHKKAGNSKSINISSNGNTIAALHHNIAKEWDYANNPCDRNPSNVSPWSDKKYYWICPKCGQSYVSTVTNRTSGQGCPSCAEKQRRQTKRRTHLTQHETLAKKHPLIAESWDYKKNEQEHFKNPMHPATPCSITSGSHYKVWWKCPNGCSSYRMPIYSRVTKNALYKCPQCSKNRSKNNK